jgi:hypothetical protein
MQDGSKLRRLMSLPPQLPGRFHANRGDLYPEPGSLVRVRPAGHDYHQLWPSAVSQDQEQVGSDPLQSTCVVFTVLASKRDLIFMKS